MTDECLAELKKLRNDLITRSKCTGYHAELRKGYKHSLNWINKIIYREKYRRAEADTLSPSEKLKRAEVEMIHWVLQEMHK